MRQTNLRLTAIIAAAILLSACAAFPPAPDGLTPAKQQVSQAQTRLASVTTGANGVVDRFSGPKLAGREVRLSDLPQGASTPWLDAPFIYVSTSQTLAEVLQGIADQVERRVRIGSMDAAWNDGERLRATFPVDWRKGSLSALLSRMAGQMNANWRVVDDSIEFYQNETRSFQVSLPPGSRTMSSSLNLGSAGAGSGGGGGGGGGGGATSSVTSTLTINTFEAVLNGVKALVGANEASASKSATVVGNPELGLITVTGRPAVLNRIAQHIETINDRVAQNVFVQIKVLSVSMTNSDYVGLSLDTILTRGLSKLQLASSAPASSGNGSPGFMTISRTGGALAGSEVVLGLLKQVGDVSIVRSGQVIAANGQPAGVQIADEVNYLAQVTNTIVANAGSQTSLTPGTRTVGFTASILPLIMADSRLLLQYTLNLSSLLGLTQNSSGGQTIQTPQISSQTLQQQAYVRDGESIVLFGFEQDRSSSDRALGIGGGGINSSSERQALVIVMDVARVGGRQ